MDAFKSTRKILRFIVLPLFLLLTFAWFSLVIYQAVILRCQPNCAQQDLQGVYLHRPFTRADSFFELVLRDVDFQEADLREANLKTVFIRSSNFQAANLENAILTGADLAWSNLEFANLRHVDLQAANLYGANLQHADLRGANLADAYLIDTMFFGAKYNEATIWPDDFDPAKVRAVIVE